MNAETDRALRLRMSLVGFLLVWIGAIALIAPLDYDEAVYSIVATGMVNGEWPYRDLFDHKPPLVYIWHLPIGLTGSIAFQRLFAAALVTASLAALLVLARRTHDPAHVALIGVSYAAFLVNPFIGTGTSAETYMLLPIIAAVFVPSAAGSGALLAVAVLTKPTAIFFLPLLLWKWRQRWWSVVAGLIALIALVSLAFVPIWSDYWDANVVFNREFSNGGASTSATNLLNVIAIQPQAIIGALPVWAAAIAGAMRFRSVDEQARVWGVCALVAIKMNTIASGVEYAHYYILLAPPVAYFAAAGFESMGRRLRARRLLFALGVISAVFFVASVPLLIRARTQYDGIVSVIRRHDGELYGIGSPPQLYPYAGRQPERRFFFENPLLIRDDWDESTRRGLERCAPDLLVVSRAVDEDLAWSLDLRSQYRGARRFGDLVLLSAPVTPCDARTVR